MLSYGKHGCCMCHFSLKRGNYKRGLITVSNEATPYLGTDKSIIKAEGVIKGKQNKFREGRKKNGDWQYLDILFYTSSFIDYFSGPFSLYEL